METKQTYVEFKKVDEDLGLVMGYAIICTVDGKPYFDLHGDHIPDSTMLKAAAGFMESSRPALDRHEGEEMGSVVFAFPLTEEIAKAFDITTKQTGLMIAMKPEDPEVLTKFKDGTYQGFSIGGLRLEDEEVD